MAVQLFLAALAEGLDGINDALHAPNSGRDSPHMRPVRQRFKA